jgi:lysyl-tRNA synthetase class 2
VPISMGLPSARVLRDRARILAALRGWMHQSGFMEIQVPIAVKSGALEEYLEPLPLGELQLHTSPEFALKRVLSIGLGRIYWMGPCFRGEELGPHHGTEFTMLEWYRVGCGYHGIADDLLSLLEHISAALGQILPALERLTWAEAMARHAQTPIPDDSQEQMRIWVNDVEPRLLSPTLVLDYPAKDAAFSSIRGPIAERFEFYWQGVELANAFTELLDPEELRSRWEESARTRQALGREPHPRDERLEQAVSKHPYAGGIALGIDRLVMLLLGLEDIHQTRVQG